MLSWLTVAVEPPALLLNLHTGSLLWSVWVEVKRQIETMAFIFIMRFNFRPVLEENVKLSIFFGSSAIF